MNIIDTIPAFSIEPGDQILIDGDPIEVNSVEEGFLDVSEITVKGYSHHSGDEVMFRLYAFDKYDLWAV